MQYLLSGFFSVNNTFPAFVLPFFTTQDSNYIYLQDLGSNFRVNRFLRVREGSFCAIASIPQDRIAVNVGAPGIMAASFDGADVLYGDISSFKAMLEDNRRKINIHDCGIFFAAEALALIGDAESARHIIEKAKDVFSSKAHADAWSSIERACLDVNSEGALGTFVNSEFEYLANNFDDELWPYKWLDCAKNGRAAFADLLPLAHSWLGGGRGRQPGGGDLILYLLRRSGSGSAERERAIFWGNNFVAEEKNISRVWVSVLFTLMQFGKDRNFLQTIYANRMISYLTQSDGIGSNTWIDAWVVGSKHVDKAVQINLAKDAFPVIGRTQKFGRKIIRTLFSWIDIDPIAVSMAREWLRLGDRYSKVWGVLFCEICDALKKEQLDPELLRDARDWLLGNTKKIKPWRRVWGRMLSCQDYKLEMIDLGKEWLKDVDIKNPSWPHIFILVRKHSHIPAEIKEKSAEWIAGPGTKYSNIMRRDVAGFDVSS